MKITITGDQQKLIYCMGYPQQALSPLSFVGLNPQTHMPHFNHNNYPGGIYPQQVPCTPNNILDKISNNIKVILSNGVIELEGTLVDFMVSGYNRVVMMAIQNHLNVTCSEEDKDGFNAVLYFETMPVEEALKVIHALPPVEQVFLCFRNMALSTTLNALINLVDLLKIEDLTKLNYVHEINPFVDLLIEVQKQHRFKGI